MNLFTEISKILSPGIDLNISIRNTGDKLTVSLIPKSKEVEDKAKDRITPLVVSGSPEELDAGFIEAIINPLEQSTGILSNMQQFEKSVKEAEANSKAKKEKKEKEQKEAEAKKKKFDKLISKADDQEKEEDYRGAVKTLTSALEFTNETSKVQKRISDLKGKLDSNSLFDQKS